MEQFADTLISLNPIWIYIAAFSIAYIENIFPPFPSDVILVAAGYLCASDRVDFYLVLLIATFGSTIGFMTMYKIGEWFGIRVIESGRYKFLQLEKIHIVEAWFKQYGYLVVVANRFLAGTRAVISFVAGISNLSFWKTTFLSAVSSLVWNAILLYAGKSLGANWRNISSYLDTYGKVVTIITVLLVIYLIWRTFIRKKNNQDNSGSNSGNAIK